MTEYCGKTGKLMHKSAATALKALNRLHTRNHGPMGNPYLCDYCKGWHHTKGRAPSVIRHNREKRLVDL